MFTYLLPKRIAVTVKPTACGALVAMLLPAVAVAVAGANQSQRMRAQKQIAHKLPVLRHELKGELLCVRLPASGPDAIVAVKARGADRLAETLLQRWGVVGRVETQSAAAFDRLGEWLARSIAKAKPRRFSNVLIWWSPEQFGGQLCPRVHIGFVPHRTSSSAFAWAHAVIRRYGTGRVELVAIEESTPV